MKVRTNRKLTYSYFRPGIFQRPGEGLAAI
jgi:hypothetical protein